MEIIFASSAMADLDDIRDYYLKEGVEHIGLKFQASIIKDIEQLTDHPDMGRVVPEFNDKNIRELIRPPFRIVYLSGLKTIHIVRVWRAERLLVL